MAERFVFFLIPFFLKMDKTDVWQLSNLDPSFWGKGSWPGSFYYKAGGHICDICYLSHVHKKEKKNIADIDIIGNFRVTRLASNQSIQIGQSAVFGFVHFPVERNNGN